MSTTHIPEEEAVKNFRAVLSRVDAGDRVLIERDGSTLALQSTITRGKTVAEAIDILRARSNSATGDATFADDIQHAMDRMRAPSDRPSPWD